MLTSFMPSSGSRELSATGEKEFPSFSASNGSLYWISAAEGQLQLANATEDEKWTDDFEFAFSGDCDRDPDATQGWIHPVYPLVNSDFLVSNSPVMGEDEAVWIPIWELLTDDRDNSSLSNTTSLSKDIGGVPPVPRSPNRWKSRSVGSASRLGRLRDLVFGRSHSDGKEKSGCFSAEKKGPKYGPGGKVAKDKVKGELDIVAAHRMYYSKKGGCRQRSFLPYKRELVGFFTGGNWLSRLQRPL